MSSVMRVACLDFDGTLCPGDSILPFLLFCITRHLAPRRQILYAAWGFLLQKLKLIPPAKAKAMTLSFLRGRKASEMQEMGRIFAKRELFPNCYPEGLRLLDKLRREGYHTVIVSASTDVYMHAMKDLLGVNAVLSTTVETDADGRYTGRIPSNCRGEEKKRRINAYLAENPALDGTVSLAVGDSRHDIPMLQMAEKQIIVGGNPEVSRACPQAETVLWQKRKEGADALRQETGGRTGRRPVERG